jgi:hypothetical protein
VLLSPATVFRDLTPEPAGIWLMLRRPLLLALACGCVVSLWASGRLSARLVADGMVSFAFLPAFQLVALAAVYWRRPRRVSFAHAADLYFAANGPWLLWLIAFATLRCLLTPTWASAAPAPLRWIVELSLLPVAVWSAYIDLHFFGNVLPRPARSAARDLILHRAIGWTCTLGYFIGIAAWATLVGWMRA